MLPFAGCTLRKHATGAPNSTFSSQNAAGEQQKDWAYNLSFPLPYDPRNFVPRICSPQTAYNLSVPLSYDPYLSYRSIIPEKESFSLPKWRYRADPDNKGLEERWFDPEVDVSSWDYDFLLFRFGEEQRTDMPYSGIVWHASELFALKYDQISKDRVILLQIENAFPSYDVWLNGKHFGHRPSGAVPAIFDVTKHIKTIRDGRNVLTIRTVYGFKSVAQALKYYETGGEPIIRFGEIGPVYPISVEQVESEIGENDTSLLIKIGLHNVSKEKKNVTVEASLCGICIECRRRDFPIKDTKVSQELNIDHSESVYTNLRIEVKTDSLEPFISETGRIRTDREIKKLLGRHEFLALAVGVFYEGKPIWLEYYQLFTTIEKKDSVIYGE